MITSTLRATAAVLAAVTLSMTLAGSPALADSAKDVVVTNTPLPVTGSVAITNTPLPVTGSVAITNFPDPETFSLRLELTDSAGGAPSVFEDITLTEDALLKTVNIQMFTHSADFCRVTIGKLLGAEEIVFLQALDDDTSTVISGIARGFSLAPGIAFDDGTDLRYVVSAPTLGVGECRAVAHLFFEVL